MGFAGLLAIIRDAGVILGVPVLIVVGVRLYRKRIALLKTQIESLQLTQFDRSLSLIKSQRELYELDRGNLEDRIAKLQQSKARNGDHDASTSHHSLPPDKSYACPNRRVGTALREGLRPWCLL